MDILVIKPSSLGDVIHALPFLKAMKDRFPESSVDWVISRGLEGLLTGNPLIRTRILINKDHWKNFREIPETVSEFSSLRRILRSASYDIVVDLQGLLRSAVIAWIAKGKETVGFTDAREGSRYFYTKKIPARSSHAVDRCLEVAGSLGADSGHPEFPLYPSSKSIASVRQKAGGLKKYIVIVPSARWESKRWPAVKFADLAMRTSFPCIIAGSIHDRPMAEIIMKRISNKAAGCRTDNPVSGSGEIIDLCGKTSLSELIALISGATAVISNDSGPMHIAAALDIPTVAIFGPTDPLKTGPYRWKTKSHLAVVSSGLQCSPCRKKTCRSSECMDGISVSRVYSALENVISNSGKSGGGL